MLIVVTILAIPLGWAAMRLKIGRDKGRAIANLRAMGVSIVMDGYEDASPMIPPRLRELFGWQSVGIALGVDSDDALSKLDGMQNLKTLGFLGDVSNSGLKHLKSMNAIENLTISSPRVTDEGLRHIADKIALKKLNLEGTEITGAGLLHLTRLRRLEKLTIDGTRMSHADVIRLFVEQGRGALDALVATGQLVQRPDEDEPFDLRLEGEQITDGLIEFLVQLPMLSSITLKSTTVTETGLNLFRGMPQLKSLGLHGEEVWKKLPTMPHIETFDVSHTTISAKQLSQHLRSLPQLKSLSLSYTPMVDEDLAVMVQIPSLQELSLGATKIGGDGLRHLAVLTKLRRLNLGNSNIADQGLRHLSHLPSLRELWLDFTSVSDAGVTYLKQLSALRKLGLVHTHITQTGLDELEEALPECEIFTRMHGRP